MKKIVAILLLLIAVAFSCAGCGKYRSHYNATAFVHSNESKSASMSFWQFEGTMVFQMKCAGKEETLRYSGQLESGGATVYYDDGQGKTELFALGPGGKTESAADGLQAGTVYLIVETDGKCENGAFRFELERSPTEGER